MSFGPERLAIAGFAQVNLLEAVVVAPRRGVPWWAPVVCAAVVSAAALGSSLHLNPRLAAMKSMALQREAQAQQQAGLIEAVARQQRGGSTQDQAQALQAALAQQQRLLALLGGTGGVPAADKTTDAAAGSAADASTAMPPTAQNFSALLEGLSQTRIDGLWLTQVRLDRRTQEVRLEGQAQDAQRVPGYIDALTRNPRFKGLVLAAVEVSRPAARGAAVKANEAIEASEPARFKLASAAVATPAANTSAVLATAAGSNKQGTAP
jgi:hypothetical protein